MEYYHRCPNCGNNEEGERIWECKCGGIHCDSCCEGEHRKCPHCHDDPGHWGFGHEIIGYIGDDD